MKEQDIYEILERDMRDMEIHLTIKQKHFVVDMLKKLFNKGVTDSAESAETKREEFYNEIEVIIKEKMGLPSYLPKESMGPTMKSSFDFGVECFKSAAKLTVSSIDKLEIDKEALLEEAKENVVKKYGCNSWVEFCRREGISVTHRHVFNQILQEHQKLLGK